MSVDMVKVRTVTLKRLGIKSRTYKKRRGIHTVPLEALCPKSWVVLTQLPPEIVKRLKKPNSGQKSSDEMEAPPPLDPGFEDEFERLYANFVLPPDKDINILDLPTDIDWMSELEIDGESDITKLDENQGKTGRDEEQEVRRQIFSDPTDIDLDILILTVDPCDEIPMPDPWKSYSELDSD